MAADYAEAIAAVEAERTVEPHWELVRTGITEGQHLRSIDLDGQREYLARKAISAWRIGDAISVAIDDYCVTVDGDTITIGGWHHPGDSPQVKVS